MPYSRIRPSTTTPTAGSSIDVLTSWAGRRAAKRRSRRRRVPSPQRNPGCHTTFGKRPPCYRGTNSDTATAADSRSSPWNRLTETSNQCREIAHCPSRHALPGLTDVQWRPSPKAAASLPQPVGQGCPGMPREDASCDKDHAPPFQTASRTTRGLLRLVAWQCIHRSQVRTSLAEPSLENEGRRGRLRHRSSRKHRRPRCAIVR